MKRLLCALLASLALAGCARVPKTALPPPARPAPAAPAAGLVHTVEKGETFYRIAKHYRIDVAALMRANGIEDPRQLEVGQRLVIPGVHRASPAAVRPPVVEPYTLDQVRRLVGPPRGSSRWHTITVHHSATLQGSAKAFHRDHSRRRMGGLFYHFVIGNGSYSDDGEIETGFRWKRQIKSNRPYDINICLVGDFNRQDVSEAQLGSLVNLVATLQRQYRIPTSHVRRHEDVKGKNTECPGRRFPFYRLLSRLKQMEGTGVS
jgi:LysM repeat protein